MNSKEYDKGYADAIEAIKKSLEGGTVEGGTAGGDLDKLPGKPVDGDPDELKGGKSGGSGDDNADVHTVTKEDLESDVAGTDIIDKEQGKKIQEKEGYDHSPENSENDWQGAARRAINEMPARGKGAGALKDRLDGIWNVTTDWKSKLRRIVGHAINDAEKRQAYANKNVLATRGEIRRTDKDKYDAMDYMMCFIDTSGSMSLPQLKLVMSEIYAVALTKKPMRLVVIQCDTAIQNIQEFHSVAELKKELMKPTLHGGGGTELKPCWDLLQTDPKYSKRPAQLVMVFTDGYLTFYKRDRRHMNNICWCITDSPSIELPDDIVDSCTKCVHLDTKDIK